MVIICEDCHGTGEIDSRVWWRASRLVWFFRELFGAMDPPREVCPRCFGFGWFSYLDRR